MPKKEGYFGVKNPKGASHNTVRTKPAPNASGNWPKSGSKNSSGNAFPGMKTGGKP